MDQLVRERSDAELLSVCARGGPEADGAFEALVSRHGGMVYHTCHRVLGAREAAEDAAQAVFLVLARKARSVRKAPGAFLHGVALRVSLRERRRQKAIRAREKEATRMLAHRDVSGDAPADPARAELRARLDQAVESLPRAQREAVVLHYLEGRSHRQVAKSMGVSEGAVARHVHRGVEKLRARLARTGLGLPAATLAGMLAGRSAEAACPEFLLAASGKLSAALGSAAGLTAAGGTAAVMAKGALKMMFWAKVKICAAAVVASAVVFGGGGLLAAGVGGSGKAKSGKKPKAITLDWKKINAQAAKEYLTPLRPGVPGKQPFWNPYARRFLYVPAFEFKPVKGAKYYRFTVASKKGRKKHVFEAPEPWAPLTPVWKDMSSGWFGLKVEGLTAKGGAVMGTARITVYGKPRQMKPAKDVEERVFEKAEVFKGPYGETLSSREYRESALRCLRFMREFPYYRQFKKTGKYTVKCPKGWVTKHVSACVSGMAYLAKHASNAKEKEEALTMARNAADYLLSISFPEGQALAHIPPMSLGGAGDKWVKMNTPYKPGHAYLDLYDACKDKKYLLAAKRIADVYKKLQLPSGTWHYKIAPADGKAVAKEELLPGNAVRFLERLIKQYGCKQYQKTAEAAVKWLLENPFKTYDWKGQFDDMPADRPPYSNHARGAPVRSAQCLLKRAGANPEYVSMAEDAVRFGEDQFTWWSRKGPFVREQYICFAAVNASLTSMIRPYLRLYEATGKEPYLAKAIALANTLVKTQTKDGCYPTWVFKGGIDGWPNCPTHTAVFMLKFADFLEKEEKKRAGK